ncbi:ABC transporter substrate-binding [Chlorella sorokiniana]|uniref:ABC transporter substrate-binding n=1 Tax=Chlorella sorokiniana TaxID=3076 RepID=A0A2P6TJW2_CHLSO|nr:ABC transporter substrate-binding [Chlorella sorokiniana]|eukprot:PRW44328.1 ABC transporter substrate-binding [Chlorella sorokiniana]
MARATALLLALALALALGPSRTAAQAADGTKKVGVLDLFPFAYKAPNGTLTGEWRFDVAVATKACELTGLKCEMVPLVVADRIPKLRDGTVDMLFAGLTKTADRAKEVLSVAPSYYASGASLFALQDKAANAADWAAIKGQKICALAGYYLNPDLKAKYGADLVEVPDSAAMLDKLVAGDCTAAVTDTTDLSLIQAGKDKGVNVVVTAAPALDPAPYAAAVRLGEEDLAVKLSGAIAQGLLSAGNSSAIFSLEDQYILSNGGQPAPYLANLAEAITCMVPCT